MLLSLPIVVREMRVQSRSRAHYMYRFGAASVVALVLYLGVLRSNRADGLEIFLFLHNSVLGLILFLGPLMACDSLSREIREGTAGLLFLTPLNAWQIVSAKFFFQLTRIALLWMAALPLGTLPLLLGGVGWTDLVISFSLQGGAALLVVSNSLLASSFSRQWARSLLLAYLLFAVAFLGMVFLLGMALVLVFSSTQGANWDYGGFLGACLAALPYIVTGMGHTWQHILSVAMPAKWLNLGAFPTFLLLGVLLGWMQLRWAARRFARFSEMETETARARWFRRVFLTPRFLTQTFFRSLRRTLDRNPLVWLEYRSAWIRSARWLLVLAVASVACHALVNGSPRNDYIEILLTLVFSSALILALKTCSGFQQERESGVLELLLVCPLTAGDILWGRIKAVWRFHRPVTLVLLLFLVAPFLWPLSYDYRVRANHGYYLLAWFLSFLSIPFVGFLFSLRLPNLIGIIASTVALTLLLPVAIYEMITWLIQAPHQSLWLQGFAVWLRPLGTALPHVVVAMQLVFTIGAGLVAYRTLEERRIYFR